MALKKIRKTSVPSFSRFRKTILELVATLDQPAPVNRVEAWIRMCYGYIESSGTDEHVVNLAISSLAECGKQNGFAPTCCFSAAIDHYTDWLTLGRVMRSPGDLQEPWDDGDDGDDDGPCRSAGI